MTPKAFVSYSFKNPSKDHIRVVIECIKETLKKRQWISLDPMTEGGGKAISEKVIQTLWEADVIFAEITASIPNVSLEAGFGAALGCPVIAFVDKSTFDRLDEGHLEDWKTYFELIRHNKDRPLPSDLGDLEYFPYSSNISSPQGRKDFQAHLSNLLDYLEQTTLSPSSCLLRRSYKKLLHSTEGLIISYHSDHPFLRQIAGWFDSLSKALNKEYPSAIEVDAHYYQDCLAAFMGYESGKAFAMADLSSRTEPFWEDNPDPLITAVSERIFLMDWKTLFNAQMLRKKINILRKQCGKYSVRVVFTPPVQRLEPFRFGEKGSALGNDLLLIEPNLVAGYVSHRVGPQIEDTKECLRIQCDDALYNKAILRYQLMHERSIEFQEDWTVETLRNEWIKKENIGNWNVQWGKIRVRERDDTYFDKYDMHIRCWIPRYEDLISETVAYVQREIMELLRNTSQGLNLLELGYGTGALTEPLLSWIDVLNTPFYTLHERPPIRRYIGIDEAHQMWQALRKRIGARFGRFTELECAEAWEDCLKPIVWNHRPYHVIFGSLILHEILGDLDEHGSDKVDEFFEQCSSLLEDKGCLIFGDSFTDEDKNKREQQVDLWKEWMLSNGLKEYQIQEFIKGNLEMINTVGPKTLQKIASKHNFSVKYIRHLNFFKTSKKTPFAVFVMQKL